jgi:uncharacterized membrane protein
MLAAGGVYFSLPERLSVGPGWGLLAVILVLMVPIAVSNRRGDFHITRPLVVIANGAITVGMITSLVWLIKDIPQHRDPPMALLRAAIALWITNIVVFALWYWKFDAGGPSRRDARTGRLKSSFLFPQMLNEEGRDPDWSPQFMDYLFLAFNTSTAFSPTDTAVLSRWAKAGTMLQSLISLAIVVLLAARAVNIF